MLNASSVSLARRLSIPAATKASDQSVVVEDGSLVDRCLSAGGEGG